MGGVSFGYEITQAADDKLAQERPLPQRRHPGRNNGVNWVVGAVIPAQAGIQVLPRCLDLPVPRLRGRDFRLRDGKRLGVWPVWLFRPRS